MTFTFNEPINGFIEGVVGGVISNFSFIYGNTSGSATFTATDNSTNTGSVTVNAGSYTDLAGSNGAVGSDIVTVDTVNPKVAITGVPALTNGSPFTATLTFSEAVTDFDDVTVDVPLGAAIDAASNGNTTAPDQTATRDNAGPTFCLTTAPIAQI